MPPVGAWFEWRFEGLEKIPQRGPALLASNHASYLDPFASAYAVVRAGRRPRFLAKRELFEIPLVGRALRGIRQIPVSRGTGDRSPLARAEAALAAGEIVVIYPEGTVTTRPDGLPMEGKTGAVRLSLASGVPITPMASWGSAPVWQKTGPGSLKFGRPVWVKVGDPIEFSDRGGHAEDFESVGQMTEELMTAITELVVDVRDRYPKRWSVEGRLARGDEV
jgi:1-acyl-sn-glycerol-3-phosphate acyltransferase